MLEMLHGTGDNMVTLKLTMFMTTTSCCDDRRGRKLTTLIALSARSAFR